MDTKKGNNMKDAKEVRRKMNKLSEKMYAPIYAYLRQSKGEHPEDAKIALLATLEVMATLIMACTKVDQRREVLEIFLKGVTDYPGFLTPKEAETADQHESLLEPVEE